MSGGISPETMAERTPLTVKTAVLAAIVGLTTQRIGQYVAEGMPKSGNDGFPLAAAVQWIINYWRTRATQTPLGDARRRKVEADAATAELDLAQRRGEVADVAMMYQVHGAECARLRTRLLAIPSKIAPRIKRLRTPAEAAEAIRAEIVEALEELIGGGKTKPGPRSGGTRAVPRGPAGGTGRKPPTAKKAVAQ